MIALWLVLAALWGGVWWRLRGGALTRLTGFDPGTGGMRAIAAVGLAAPLLAITWHYVWMMPVLWVAWSLAGWGFAQGMGHETSVEEKNPVARALERMGLTLVQIDIVGMAIEGCYCLLLPGLLLGWIENWLSGLALIASGLFFSPIYYVWQRVLPVPNWGGFSAAGSEWAEVSVGAWIGVVMAALLMFG